MMKFRKLNIESTKESFYNPIDNNRVSTGINKVLYWNTGIYGKKNDNAFPDFLVDVVENGTSIHSNIINLKTNLITGDNLQPADMDVEGTDRLVNFIEKRNRQNQNLKNIYAFSARQFALFEMAYLQVVYSKDFSRIAGVYSVPVKDVRWEIYNALGNVESYFISKRWTDISNKYYKKASVKNQAIQIPAYTGKEMAKQLNQPVQLLCIQRPDYGDGYVSPSYMGGMLWILASNYIANFHSNNFKTGFQHQGMLVTYGQMSEDEEKQFAHDLEELFAGSVTNDKKRLMLANVENKEMTPQFVSSQNLMQDKQYESLIKEANQQVVSAHNCHPILCGLDGGKGADLGGDSNRLNTALKSFRLLTTDPMKDYLVAGFNFLMEDEGLPMLDVDTSNFVISDDSEGDDTAPDDPVTSEGREAEEDVEQIQGE